ncbi:ribonuclease H-like domain-containing protein [Tanacetum coccineum]
MAEVLIKSLDARNPLFLQNNDNSSISLISVKLTGTDNYKMWFTARKIALTGRNKMGFVNGTCVKPATTPVLAKQWERCNAVVLGWILNSLSPELYLGQVYSEIASDVWNELQETYDKLNGSVIFNVIHKINALKQGDLSVPDYYHKLNSLWREFDTLTLLPTCTCGAHEGVLRHNQLIRLMQFLMGLNDVYQNIRSNILARDPLLDVREAFNVVSREESHRGLHPRSGSGSGNKVQPAAFVAKSNNFRGNDFKRGNNNSANRGLNPNLLCKNCRLIGHTIERCYEIIGYPAGFKRNPNLTRQGGNSNGNNKGFNGNVEAPMGASTSSGSTSFDTPFTKDQMMKILSLINEKPSTSANASMAGMKPTFFNGNAFFNLHFEKFFYAQTCSYMYNLTMGWIIDSMANQHLTNSTKDMFNVSDISSLNLTLGHPNGTLAKVSAIGCLRLTTNVVLFDVLVVPEYNVNLMSVHKLIKDSKLFVGFDETKCYIQDLNLVKTLGTGSKAGGLYLFDVKQSGESIVGLSNSTFVCHASKQLWHNRLGNPADQVLSVLIHFDLWGPYKVVSRDGYKYFLTVVDDYSRAVWAYLVKSKDETWLPSSVLSGASPYLLVYKKKPSLSHIRCFGCLCYSTILNNHDKFSPRDVTFYETIFPLKMKNESLNSKHVSHEYESELNLLNFFDETNNLTPKMPNDDERDHSSGDGNVMAPHDINSSHPVDEDATFATLLNENTITFEGQQSSSNASPRFNNNNQRDSDIKDKPQTVRKSSKVSKLPPKFNYYVMPSNKKYGIEKHVEAMNNEMEALFRNNTSVLVDLLPNRKTIGCKWLWKIKYKSTGEIERYKARLVAKGFSQRDGIDYAETFSPVIKMVTVRCIISLVVHNNWPLFQLDVNNAFLYGDLHENVYMDLPPGYYDASETRVSKLHDNGIVLALLVYVDDIVITGNNVEEISKFKKFLASKSQIKDLGSLKYLLGIEVLENKNGLCLSQKKYCLELLNEYGLLACKPAATPIQHNVSLSHDETDKDKRLLNHMHSHLKSHFSAGLRVLRYLKQSPGLGIANLLKDLGVEGLLPVPLYCDSSSAIQIVANPVFHEKTKHFEIDVHWVREKVASGAISTVKIDSAKNIADVFSKGLSISQHKQFCLQLNLVDMFGV